MLWNFLAANEFRFFGFIKFVSIEHGMFERISAKRRKQKCAISNQTNHSHAVLLTSSIRTRTLYTTTHHTHTHTGQTYPDTHTHKDSHISTKHHPFSTMYFIWFGRFTYKLEKSILAMLRIQDTIHRRRQVFLYLYKTPLHHCIDDKGGKNGFSFALHCTETRIQNLEYIYVHKRHSAIAFCNRYLHAKMEKKKKKT